MDLKDTVTQVELDATEALSAYNAGHHEKAEEYLCSIENTVGQHIRENIKKANDVTESATSETLAETSKETPAQPPGPAAQAGAVLPAADAQKKALDQAGP